VAVAMVVNYTADQMGPQAMLLVLPGALVMWFLAKVQQGGAMRAGRPMLRKGAYWWAAVGLGLIVLMLQAAAFNGFE